MSLQRAAGILLHPTSLPGRYGIGDLGREAYRFIDYIYSAGQTIWQVFPLGPTGYGDSPYQCFSAFAGNPLLISPDLLAEDGLLTDEELTHVPEFDHTSVDFGAAIPYKTGLLKAAFKRFISANRHQDAAFLSFIEQHALWLNDYALFTAVKEYHGGVAWIDWDKGISLRQGDAVHQWTEKLRDGILYVQFVQYIFYKQWSQIKRYANSKGIRVLGDMPLFIAYDSADLWANKELFTVNEKGRLLTVAGVPPDYFSPTGQLWGNPLYRYDVMKRDNYQWWRNRFAALHELVDIIRIDHFRGMEAFWEIPGDAPTAETGKWVKAPGAEVLSAVMNHLGPIDIIAEDLGIITDEVVALREQFNLPGMKILQFAFGTGMEKKFLPHNFVQNCAVYTGSHDNDTTRGYFEKEKNNPGNDIYEFTQKYLNYYGEDVTGELIRTAYASVANTVVVPMQDILRLGSEARMNFPGKLGGNWTWRFTWDQLTEEHVHTLSAFVQLYDRKPEKKEK